MRNQTYLTRRNPLYWLGFFEIDGWGLRGKLFDVYLRRFALGLTYSVYHDEAHIYLGLIFVEFYVKVPMVITQRHGTEDWNACYGAKYFGSTIHLNWRDRCKVVYLPWDWTHVRHDYLNTDGTLHHRVGDWDFERPAETKLTFPYTYVLKRGEVQHRTATVNGEEREWRWRWLAWSPWPRKVQRSINVEFSDEVGERTGSWKGGTVGCGYEWKRGETLEQALRRMERERTF